MGAYLFVGVSISIQTPSIALIGISVLAAFMLLYFIAQRFSKTPIVSTHQELD
jgi:hypothetical protein